MSDSAGKGPTGTNLTEPRQESEHPPHQQKLLRVPGATALIIGGVIGTGVFTLPSTLAPYGMLAIVGLLVVTFGAIAVGVVFSQLARRIPRAGGPFAYPRAVFGSFIGFTAAWSYWLSTAIGNAGIVVSWVFYVNFMFGWTETNRARDIGVAMIGLWIPVFINFIGLNHVRRFQVVTVIVKMVPLVFMTTIGLAVAISRWEFPSFNPSGGVPIVVIAVTGALVLFIYLGVEDATSAAGRVADPKRNVPRATIIGTLVCAVLYVGSTIAIFGLVSPTALGETGAPFSAAVESIIPMDGAGKLIAFFAVVSGLGALNGLTLLVAEVPRAAAEAGLFPKAFTWLTSREAPWVGLLVSAGLASALVIISNVGQSGLSVFNTLILLTGITSALPYFLSALAQLRLLFAADDRYSGVRLVRDATVAIIAAGFAIWCIIGSGLQPIVVAVGLILLGYVVYGTQLWLERRAASHAR